MTCGSRCRSDKPGFIRSKPQRIGDVEALLVPAGLREIPRIRCAAETARAGPLTISTTQGDLKAVVDGYNAPLTGAFVDLALKGFYDGLPSSAPRISMRCRAVIWSELGYIDLRQAGTPRSSRNSRARGAGHLLETLEDVGFQGTPTLPLTLGTLGWAHSANALDDGSSQFLCFSTKRATPAGLNLVDGRNAAYGYVVDGFDVLRSSQRMIGSVDQGHRRC